MLRDREWQYRDGRLLVQGRTGDARGRNGIIRTSAMREKKKETARVRYSTACPMDYIVGDESYHINCITKGRHCEYPC